MMLIDSLLDGPYGRRSSARHGIQRDSPTLDGYTEMAEAPGVLHDSPPLVGCHPCVKSAAVVEHAVQAGNWGGAQRFDDGLDGISFAGIGQRRFGHRRGAQ